jgi:hypothetical protein
VEWSVTPGFHGDEQGGDEDGEEAARSEAKG